MNRKNILSSILLLILSFDVVSCSKVRFKDRKNEPKFSDVDDLPFNADYQLDLRNAFNLEDFEEDDEKPFVDYEAKAKYEKLISDKLVLLGVNEFKLPEAFNYSDGIFGGIYVSNLKVSVSSYKKYIDELLKDFEKETDLLGREVYYKQFGQLKYSISFTFENDNFSIDVSPSNKLWSLDLMNDPLKQKPFTDNLYTAENYCLTTKIEGEEYKTYCVNGEFIEFKDKDNLYADGTYIAYRDGLYYSARIYDNNVLETDDLIGPYASSYAHDISFLTEMLKDTHIFLPLQYINICKDCSSGINLGPLQFTLYTDSRFDLFDNHDLLGYELYNGYYCAVLSNVGKVGRFSNGWEYKMYVDTKTGYIVKLDKKNGKNIETYFTCDIEYNDYAIHFEDKDNKTYISLEETIIPKKDCNVKFTDFDGNVISTCTVKSRQAAMPPIVPKKDGKLFTGWDYTFNDIKEDVTIHPESDQLKKCTVKFLDFDGNEISSQQVTKYNSATAPKKNPYKFEYTFNGWDKRFDVIYDDLTINPIFTPINYHEVIFKDWNDDILKSEMVLDGKSATAPKKEPKRKDYVFVGWSKDFDNVTEDLEIIAMYAPNDSKVTFGSVTYYYNKIVAKANNLEGEDKTEFIFDKINDLATAAALNDYTESMLNEGKAITQAFPCSESWNNFGVMLINAGYLENAAQYFENAIQYDSENEVYLTNLAEVFFVHEKNEGSTSFAKTLELIKKAIAANSCYGLAYQLRSSIYLEQGKEDQALDDLIYSAKWIWNDVSIAHFKSLYDSLDEKFDKAIYMAEHEKYDVKVNFKSPLEGYIDDLKEIAVLERGWSEGMTETFNYPVQYAPATYHNNVNNFKAYADSISKNQKEAMQDVNYYVINRYLKDNDGYDEDGYYLIDSRAFMMARLVNQYYDQKIQIATKRKNQKADGLFEDYINSQAEPDNPSYSENPKDEFEVIKKVADKFRLPDGTIDSQAMTQYFLNEEYDLLRVKFTKYANDEERKGVYNEQAYDEFLKELLSQYYYDMTYFTFANMNEDVQNYFYALIYNTTYEVVKNEYLEAASIGYNALMMYQIIEMIKDIWGIHDTNEDDIKQEENRQKAIKAMKADNQSSGYKGPDLSLGFSVGVGDVSLNVSYSLISGDGEFGFDSPLISRSHKYEKATGQKTTTTLFYGTAHANQQIIESTAMGLADEYIPAFSDLHPYSFNTTTGYGNQVTIDKNGNILENVKIKYESRTFNAGDSSMSMGYTYTYDSKLAAYSFDSMQTSLGYGNISVTISD